MASALEELRTQLAQDPTDADALGRLEGECLETRDFAALRATFEGLAGAADAATGRELLARVARFAEAAAGGTEAPRERVELLLRAADLQAGPLNDPEAAARLLAAAWAVVPDARVVDRVWAQLGRPEAARAPEFLLQARAATDDGDGRVAALHQLAARRLEAERFAEARELLEAITAARPDDRRAREGLETVERLERERVEARQAAEAAARSAGDEGREAAEAWTRYAAELRAAGDEAGAEQALRKALAAGPAGRAEAELEALLRRAGRLEELAAFLRERLERADEAGRGGVRVLLRRKLVRLLREDLGRPDEAQRLLIVPADQATVDARAALEAAQAEAEAGAWAQAVARLEEAEAGARTPQDRLALLEAAARVLDEQAGDAEAAERLYRRVRVLDARSLAALTFYRGWYAAQGDARRAHATLAQLLEVLEGPELAAERIEVSAEMARLAATFEGVDPMIDAWRRVLAEDPDHEEALAALRDGLAAAGRWHALVEHLERWLARLPEAAVDRKTALLFELIEVYQAPDRLPMEDMVTATYERIVRLAPAEARAAKHLATRYEDRQRYKDLLGLLRRRVEATDSPEELLEVFGQIATLLIDHVRSDAEAIPALERILALDPGNLDVVRRLRDIHARRHDGERLYRTYQRELELLEGAERLEVLVELARLASDELLRQGEAVAWWRQVLAIEPTHERALAALKELHAEREDWDGYVKVLEERLEAAGTRKQRVEVLQELGEVLYGRLGDDERARSIFAEICELSPFNTQARNFLQRIYVARRAWDELARLYTPGEDWKAYAALLVDFSGKTSDPALLADLHVEIARVHEAHLEDPRRAVGSLESALAAAPERVDVARMLLERFSDSTPAPRRMAAWESVARHAEETRERGEAWARLAELRQSAGDAAGAFAAWTEALLCGAEAGELAHLSAVEEAAAKADALPEVASVLSDALGRLPREAVEARIRGHRALGHLARHRLLDPERAIPHFKWVLQLAPGDADALASLEEIHLSRNDFEGLEEVLRARAETAADAAVRLAALQRLGRLYEDVLADAERAAATYQRILAERPEDAEALAALRSVLGSVDAHAELAEALEELLGRLSASPEAHPLRLELAGLYAGPLDDAAAALEHLRIALAAAEAEGGERYAEVVEALVALLRSARDAQPVIGALEPALRRLGDLERLGELLETKLQVATTLDDRLAILGELALLAQEVRGDDLEAFTWHTARFRLVPDDRDTWSELAALAERTAAVDGLVALWAEALAPPEGDDAACVDAPEDRKALRLAMAALLTRTGAHEEEIAAVYEGILAESERAADHPDVLEALEGLYEAAGAHEALVPVLLAAGEAALSGVHRRDKVLQAAVLLEDALGRDDEALAQYWRLLDEDPADAQVGARAEALVRRLERWEELGALLLQRVEALPAGEARDREALTLARLELDVLGRAEAAQERLTDLVGSAAVGAEARVDLLGIARSDDTTSERRLRILKALDAWFEAEGRIEADPEAYAEVLLVHAIEAKPGPARARVLRQAASLLAPAEGAELPAGERPRRAFALFARALGEHPGDRSALDGLDALAGPLDNWPSYVQIMSVCADKADVPAVAHTLWQREATAAEERLGDLPRAIAAWERLVQSAKDGSGDAVRAIEALDRLYDVTEQHAERIRILRMRRAAVRKPTVRLPLLAEEARLQHRIRKTDEAMVALRAILAETQSATKSDLLDIRKDAVRHAAELMAEAGRYDELRQFLVETADDLRAKDPAAALELRFEAARVVEEHLDDPEGALALFEHVHRQAPRHEGALDALDRLYQSAGRWADKVALITERLELLAEGERVEEQTRWLFTLGQICDNRLGRHAEALAAYQRILTLTPGFVPALAALRMRLTSDSDEAQRALPLLVAGYEAIGQSEQVVALLTQVLGSGAPRLDVAAIHGELARLLLARGAAEQGWTHASRAYLAGPSGEAGEARRALMLEAAAAAAVEEGLASVLLRASLGITDAAERRARREADVALLRDRGVGEAELLPFWKALLADDPSHGEALDRLEQAARERGDVDDLIAVLRAREATEVDADAQRGAREELVALLLSSAGRRPEAVPFLEAMLAQEPDSHAVFEQLEGLYRELDRHADLADLLERRIDVAAPDEQREVRKQLALTWWQGLRDVDRAIALYARVLKDHPDDAEAAEALEAMWGEGVEREPLLGILEPLYEARADWDRLVALYNSTLEQEGEAELQTICLAKMARIELHQLARPEAAYGTFKILVSGAEPMEPWLDEIEALAEQLGVWDDLVGFYEEQVAAGRGEPAFVHRVASLHETRRGDVDRALRFHRLVLAREPHFEAARDDMTRLLTGAGRWEELSLHLHHAAETHLALADKVAAYRAEADVLRRRLGRPDDAVRVLERIVELDPDNTEARVEVGAILEATGQQDRLIEHYRRWLERAPDDRMARDVQARLGRALSLKPETVGAGLHELEQVLRAAPDHVEALEAMASVVELAETQAKGATGRELEHWRAASTFVARVLGELLGEDGTPQQRAALLRARLPGTPDGKERAEVLRQLAALYEEAGQAREAFKYGALGLVEHPADEPLATRIAALAEANGLLEGLATLWDRCATAAASQPDIVGRYALRLAELLDGRLERGAEAVRWFEKVLEAQPTHERALAALSRHYRDSGAKADEARVLERYAALAAAPEETLARRVRLATLQMDHLAQEQAALATLEACLPEGSADPELRRRLERLYGARQDFASLVALYDAALAREVPDPARIELLAKKAQLCEVRLRDLDAAQEACHAILAIDGTHKFGLTSLERIERARGDWEAVDAVLARRGQAAEDDAERLRVLIERAQVAMSRRERPEAAVPLLEEAAALAGEASLPDGLLKAWEALCDHDSTRLTAAAWLEPRYRALARWDGLVAVLDLRRASASPDERALLAMEMAELAEARLGDPEAALHVLADELSSQPGSAVLRETLTDVALRAGRWQELVAVVEDLIGRQQAAGVTVTLTRWLATLQLSGLDDAAAAARSYEQILALDADDAEAREALEGLYRQLKQWDKLFALAQATLESVPAAERPARLLEMARVVAEQDGPRAAVPLLRDVLALDPTHAEARAWLVGLLSDGEAAAAAAEVLEPVLREAGDFAGLANVLELRARGVGDAEARAATWAEVGDLFDERLDDELRAFEAYGHALEARPQTGDVLRRLGRIAHKHNLWGRMCALLERVIPASDDLEARRDLLLHLAQLQEIKLSKPDRAVDALQEVLALEDHHRGALMGLRRLYLQLGQLPELMEVTARCDELALDAGERQRFWHDVLRVAEARQDRAAMTQACEAGLEADPYDQLLGVRLVGLYETAGRYAELEKLLATQAEGAVDPKRVASIRLSLGRIREQHLKDLDGALSAYEEAWALDPTLTDTAERLEAHYRERDDWPRLFALLASRGERSRDKRQAVGLLVEAASLAETRLEDVGEAIRLYEAALERDPKNERAMDELLRIYHRHQRHEPLARLYERKADITGAVADKRTLKVLAAEIHAQRLGDVDRAETLLAEIEAADPKHPKALAVRAHIEASRGRGFEAAALLEGLLKQSKGTQRFETLMSLGRLYLERLTRPNDALRVLLEAQQVNPAHPDLKPLLRQVFEVTGSWSDLRDVLAAEYEAAATPLDKCERALALARLSREHLQDDAGFLAWVDKAGAARRDSPEVAEALIGYYTEREMWAEVAPRLEWLVSYLEGKKIVEELPRRAHELGRLLERLGQTAKALDYYKMALQADGMYVPNLVDYGRLLVEHKQWERALRVHQNLLMQSQKLEGEAARSQVLFNLAMASRELGEVTKAKQYLNRLLKQSPDHAEAKAMLARL